MFRAAVLDPTAISPSEELADMQCPLRRECQAILAVDRDTPRIEARAKQYAPQAMEALVEIATSGKSDSALVAASLPILDRVFGSHDIPFRRKTSQTFGTLFQIGR